MSNGTPVLSQRATFALDLAKRRDGYLAEGGEVIDELHSARLITTQYVGDGFVIVRAIPQPSHRRAGNGQWSWHQNEISP